jgi:hypothetical protein
MRRSSVSLVILIIGLALGIGGGLFYAWQIDPRVEFDTSPWQLSQTGQQQYMLAVALAYSQDHDLQRAAERLQSLQLGGQTWQVMASTACDLSRTSYISTTTGLLAVRSMVALSQSQGAVGCASQLLPADTGTPEPSPTVVTVTPSLIPPATKTPRPTLGPTFTPENLQPSDASPTPTGQFQLARVEPYCSNKTPGLIEIYVQDVDGAGLPGIQIQVETLGGQNAGKQVFYTGLKTEADPGYADFQMDANGSYIVSLPNLSDTTSSREASSCNVAQRDGGGKSVVSYRITFRRVAGS